MGPTRMSFNVSLGVGATKDCQQTDKASRVRGTQVGTTGCSHADAEEVPLSHSPASSLPRQPRCPRTRLTPCMPAESEDPRRYTPHIVWTLRFCIGSWRTEKFRERFRPPKISISTLRV